jgi:hypothetical protein
MRVAARAFFAERLLSTVTTAYRELGKHLLLEDKQQLWNLELANHMFL